MLKIFMQSRTSLLQVFVNGRTAKSILSSTKTNLIFQNQKSTVPVVFHNHRHSSFPNLAVPKYENTCNYKESKIRTRHLSSGIDKNGPAVAIEDLQKLKSQMDVLKQHLNSVKKNRENGETNSKPRVVLFEGNIGCGKSTCLEHIRTKYPQAEAMVEPLNKWTDIDGHNALSLLYEDYRRWCFQFESYALLTRLQQHLKASNYPVKLLERSLYSTMHIFIENDISKGALHPMEYAMLKQWYDWIVSDVNAPVDLIVYLQCSPETCYERTKTRARQEERNVPFSYAQELGQRYEDWLMKKLYPVPAPVLIIDANQPLDKVLRQIDSQKDEIFCGSA